MSHLAFQTSPQSSNVKPFHDDNVSDWNANGGTRWWRGYLQRHLSQPPWFTQIRFTHFSAFLQTFTTG
jgi:hypothetical protein